MKKFLSLLLAVVMTLSLVTISAGATEYKDLTDKDELGPQYQEAVAVLNKIGVITGYDDGSFRPDVKLTRGAAAKIIVSLLIGPEAASNLPNNYAPYPDVPSNHTFAGVISFCKTKGIISGYGDGTFKPANDLTGYAFAKMLLGALGYDSATERFTGTGWTQNVLSIGQYASLFDRLDFKGSEAVSRKDAALLALNTLKATVVEYNNPLNISVTGDNTNVVVSGGQVRSYKTSNQEYAKNIRTHTQENVDDDWWTVEFAEDHFVDLRMTHDKYRPTNDDWGRPSAEWSYKKVSIGKFPLEADYEYTTQVIHDVDTVTPASKVRALDLNEFYIDNATSVCVNGVSTTISEVADIADFTDFGTLVQVYLDDNGSDRIRNVVVVKSQLMEVRRVGSDYVSLDIYDDGSDGKDGKIYGFNQLPIDKKINNAEVGDDYYEMLSGLKADDLVVVEPLSTDGGVTYEVGHAYVPETVKGALNGVPDRYGDATHKYNSLSVDVGGTTYMNSLWNKDLTAIDPDAVKITKKDVTLTLDRYGYAMLAEDVGETTGWMIIANYRQSIVNGILVTFANGWDGDGNEVSLNIGARAGVTSGNDDVWDRTGLFPIGTVVAYSNNVTSNTAEWKLTRTNDDGAVYDVYQGLNNDGVTPYAIGANSSTVSVVYDADNPDPIYTPLMANNIKFIYVTMDESGELDSIEIKKGRTKVENSELSSDVFDGKNGYGDAQAFVNLKDSDGKIGENSKVEAVVIKKESNDSSYKNMLYVVDYKGSSMKDANGEVVQGYEVAMMSENGLLDTQTIYAYRTNLQPGNFARYTKSTHDDHPDDFYTLRPYGAEAIDTAGRGNAVAKTTVVGFKSANNRLVTVGTLGNTRATGFNIEQTYTSDYNTFGDGGSGTTFANSMVNLQGAEWLDLSDWTQDIESAKELKEAWDSGKNRVTITLLFNDDKDSDYFRNVYLIIVNSVEIGKGSGDNQQETGDLKAVAGKDDGKNIKTAAPIIQEYAGGVKVLSGLKITAPEWVDFKTADGKDHASTPALALKSVTVTRKDKDGKVYQGGTHDYQTAGTNLKWNSAGYYEVVFGSTVSGTTTILDFDYSKFAEGDYLEVSDVQWTRALIKVEAASGVDASLFTVKATTGTHTSLPVASTGTPSASTLTFTASLGAAATGNYTIKNATSTPAATGGAISNLQNSASAESWLANGGDFVVVTITPTAAVNPVFTVSYDTDVNTGVTITGGETAKAKVTADPAASIAKNDYVTFTAEMTAATTANGVESYDITIELRNAAGKAVKTHTFEKVTNTNKPTLMWSATESVTVFITNTKANVSAIQPTGDAPVVSNSNKTVAIPFTGNLNAVVADDVETLRGGSAGPNCTGVGVDGNKLVMTFDAALVVGDVIIVKKNAITVNSLSGLSARSVLYAAINSDAPVFAFVVTAPTESTIAVEFDGTMTKSAAVTKSTNAAAEAANTTKLNELVTAAKTVQLAEYAQTTSGQDVTTTEIATEVESALSDANVASAPDGDPKVTVEVTVTITKQPVEADESADPAVEAANGSYTAAVAITVGEGDTAKTQTVNFTGGVITPYE